MLSTSGAFHLLRQTKAVFPTPVRPVPLTVQADKEGKCLLCSDY